MVMAEGRFHQSMDQKPSAMAEFARFLGYLIVPVLLLAGAMVGGFLDRAEPVSLLGALPLPRPVFEPGSWFTMGHVWVFGLFLIVNLTGRRHGAAVAFSALVLAGLGAALVWAYATYGDAHVLLPAEVIAALTDRTMVLAVALSVGIGLILNIVVFDLVRGRPWWKAPLLAPLFGGAAYAALFHLLASSLGGSYMERLVPHLIVVVLATLLMLVVYHALRSFIRPRAGYGGA